MPPSRTARVSGPSTHTVSPPLSRIAPGEIGRGQIVVAGDGEERPPQLAPPYGLTKRVLPQPVGPLADSGKRRRKASSNSTHSLPLAR